MHVVRLHGPNDVRMDMDSSFTGVVGANQLRVRTISTAISNGTELAIATGAATLPFYGWPFTYPSAMGYMNVGRVVAVGKSVANVVPGDLLYTLREHAEELIVSTSEPHWRLPPGIDLTVAPFAYLLSLGAHALRRASLALGERVAVVGLGPIGLAAVAIARELGSPVTAIDPTPYRRDLARSLGADRLLDSSSAEVAYVEAHVVIEAAGTWSGVRTAVAAAMNLGRIAVLALHPTTPDFDVLGQAFYAKQVALISASFQQSENLGSTWPPRWTVEPTRAACTLERGVQDAIDRIAVNPGIFAPAITHRLTSVDLPGAYVRIASGQLVSGAIAVTWS